MSGEDNRRFWNARIRRDRRRLNMFVWAERSAVLWFCSCCTLAFGCYLLRRQGVEYFWLMAASLVLFLFLAVATYLSCKKYMLRNRDVRALLDEQLSLNSSLCAAEELHDLVLPGREAYRAYWSCRSYGFIPWFAGGLSVLALGLWLPVGSSGNLFEENEVSPPPAVAAMESLLTQLGQVEQIDEESLKPFEEQLESFKKHTPEEMYTHSSLEAADSMLSNLESAMTEFSQKINQLDAAMAECMQEDDGTGASARKEMENALCLMDSSAIKTGAHMSEQLAQMGNPSSAAQMTPEQMQQLRARLQELKEQMQACANSGGGLAKGDVKDPDSDKYSPLGKGDGTRGEGDGDHNETGQGGVGRGEGDAPLTFKDKRSESDANTEEKLDPKNYENAALGQFTGTSQGAHDPTDDGGITSHDAGGVGHASQGGDAVWEDRLTPQERAALKTIFK